MTVVARFAIERKRCLGADGVPVAQLPAFAADREARSRGLDIICYFHSHPDHPARPSEFDRRHAHPFLIYAILAVAQGEPRELTAWRLSEDMSQFLPAELKIVEDPA